MNLIDMERIRFEHYFIVFCVPSPHHFRKRIKVSINVRDWCIDFPGCNYLNNRQKTIVRSIQNQKKIEREKEIHEKEGKKGAGQRVTHTCTYHECDRTPMSNQLEGTERLRIPPRTPLLIIPERGKAEGQTDPIERPCPTRPYCVQEGLGRRQGHQVSSVTVGPSWARTRHC